MFIPISLPQARRFLTRMDPVSMVRAALGRRKYRDLAWTVAGVEAWPTTHAKEAIANNLRLTSRRSPQG